MKIKRFDRRFSVCKLSSISGIDLGREFCFVGKTDGDIARLPDRRCAAGLYRTRRRLARDEDRGRAGLFTHRDTLKDLDDPRRKQDRHFRRLNIQHGLYPGQGRELRQSARGSR